MVLSVGLSRREKERILKALESDREFRYALMGLLGFREILERFARLEERQQKLEERMIRLEERFARLEERQQKLERKFAELEEKFAKLEERFLRLEERQQRLEEKFAKLEERHQKLEERMIRLEERMVRLEKTLATVAHRFGVLSEASFREALSSIFEEYFGVEARRWSVFDEEGLVYGHPSMVEADVVIRDGVTILVEVKSRVDTGDVLELARVGRLFEVKESRRADLVVIGGFVSSRALDLARRLGVKVYTYIGES